MPMLRTLLTRLRRQDGIALPTVMGSLLLTTTLATTTLVVSLDGNQATTKDRDAKRATTAAQAAVERAFLITTQRGPGPGDCVIEDPTKVDQTPPPEPNGECPTTTTISNAQGMAGGGLGNGVTTRWTVGTEGAAGCKELPNDPRAAGDPTRLQDRCITASATVNGVTRRMQSRILYLPPVTPWKQAGLVGKVSVELGNNATINSPVGTNGTISAGSNTDVTGNLYLPPPCPPATPGAQCGTVDFHHQSDYGDRVDFSWKFPEIDWETPRQEHAKAEERLIKDVQTRSTGGVTYNPATKILNLNSGTLTLTGGLYHLCGITGWNNATLLVPSDAKASVWIDSHRGLTVPEGSTPSPCGGPGTSVTPDTGRLQLDKNAMMINTDGTKNPLELQLFVYGTPSNFNNTGDPDVVIKNGTEFYGTIWAPESNIDFKNNGAVGGGITGKNLDLKNNGGFTHDSRIVDVPLPGTGVAKRRGWTECQPERAVATDPESGCD